MSTKKYKRQNSKSDEIYHKNNKRKITSTTNIKQPKNKKWIY